MTNKKYNIVKDRVEIYEDFAMNLLYYIFFYYLDPETLSDDKDIYNHYSWCFKKVCDEFLLEDIDFIENVELKKYFYSYYYQQFYKTSNRNATLTYYNGAFWNGSVRTPGTVSGT